MHPMQHAIDSARDGLEAGHGGPFGACIVKEGKVISVAHNTVLRDGDPTCHAEMNAIRMAANYLGHYHLEGCEIYTTAEPCPMCLGAIYWARIDKIHAGSTKECTGKHGWDDALFYEELSRSPQDKKVPITVGIMAEECESLFEIWANAQEGFY